MKVKKAFAFLLCAVWGLTVSSAGAGSSFLQDDVHDDSTNVCRHAAQSEETNPQSLIQCLQNASLETLGKMDWYGSPLWKMGQYIFEHPELKTLYEDRLKPLCDAYMVSVFQNPSLEQLATVPYRWHSPYVANCLMGDILLKYDSYIGQALETFSFAHLRETGDLASPLFALRDHLCQNSALRSQYKQHVLSLLQHASLEEIASLHVDTPSKHLDTSHDIPWNWLDSFFLLNPSERLLYPHNLRVEQLLQDISFPDLLRMHNEESSLWGLGQHILGHSGDLKNDHDQRMAQVITSLSFAELLDICDPFLSQVKDYIYDHPTLNTPYTQRIKDMLQGFSVKEIGKLHWRTPSKKAGTTRYIPWHELGYLSLTEARDTRVMQLLQDISFPDFLSIQHVLKSPSVTFQSQCQQIVKADVNGNFVG